MTSSERLKVKNLINILEKGLAQVKIISSTKLPDYSSLEKGIKALQRLLKILLERRSNPNIDRAVIDVDSFSEKID